MHTSVKKLTYNYCVKMFYNQSNVEGHELRNHTSKFPHVCADCGCGYLRPGQLKNHYELESLELSLELELIMDWMISFTL